MHKHNVSIVFGLLLIFVSFATDAKETLVLPDTITSPVQAGDVTGLERIGAYSKLSEKLIVWWNGMSKRLPVKNGITMYRVKYLTAGENGDLVEVSGLLSVPRDLRATSVISWQHGTAFKHQDAPSTPSPDEGVMASILFAGNASILLAPDYIGLGESSLPHPYYYLPTTVSSTRDLILASQAIFKASKIDYPNKLFLAGFSQGGHNTMATTRELEKAPLADITLVASASIAGPIDLDGFSFDNVLLGESQHSSTYIAYMLSTFARIYSHNLSDVLRSPYAELIPDLFDTKLSDPGIATRLPRDPKHLFREDYLDKLEQGNRGWPGLRMAENDLDNWVPKTSLRLYYGSKDVDVSPREAIAKAAYWQQAGAQVQAVDVGALDHNNSALEAALLIRKWFADLDQEAVYPKP